MDYPAVGLRLVIWDSKKVDIIRLTKINPSRKGVVTLRHH